MKTSIIAVLSAIFITACGGSAATQSAQTSSTGGPTMVCSTDNLPSGWVVIAHSQSESCGSLQWTSMDYWNQYTVELAGDSVTVCDDSPIPSGYVKKSSVRSIECMIPMDTSMDYTNAFVIEKL